MTFEGRATGISDDVIPVDQSDCPRSVLRFTMSRLDRLVPGHGTVAAQLRETDWSTHPLGPIERWPLALRTALTACLAARSPMQLWWGPQALVFYNDAFIPWLGERHPRALGRPASEVFAARWDILGSALQRVVIEGAAVETSGLSLLPLAGTAGTVDGVVCTFAPDRVSEELFASLDHEVRNPLNALSTLSAVLSQRMPGELDSLAHPLRQLSRVIEDLLDVARLSRGKLSLLRSPGELAPIIDRALDLVVPLAEQRGTKLFVSTPRIGMPITADSERLARACAHLLERAVRHAVPGSSIVIEAARPHAAFVVSITYEPAATRDAPAPDHSYRGALLANSLIEMHGGSVVERQAGGTHEVAIELPPADAAELALPAPTARSHNRVLLVEDDDANAQALKLLLEQFGYVVALAHDAAVALQVANAFEPDIALIDIGLPVLDGWEVARRLREKLGDIPVIAATGRNQPADMQHSLDAGFFDHLTKPFDVEQLRRCLESLRSGQPSQLSRLAADPPAARKPV